VTSADPDWLDRGEYPFADHLLETPHGRVHYVDEGRGPALLMVHGQPTWSFMYRHVIRGLSPRFRCIAVDLLGFGLSEKPRRFDYRPADHAATLRRLVDHLELDRTSLLVHDWGGPIGLGFGVENAERIERIVALDTWMWSMAEQRAGRWFSRILGSPLGQLATRRLDLFVDPFLRRALPQETWQRVGACYRGPLAHPADRQGCALFPKRLVDPWLESVWAGREALADRPALLVWGGADPAFPAASRERLAGVFTDCTVDVRDGVGHFVAEELGPELAATIDAWWSRIDARAESP